MDDKKKMMTTLAGLGLSAAAALSGAFIIAPSEGYHPETYLDPVGIATDCFGHTGPDVKLGYTNSHEECLNKFAKDVSKAEVSVDKTIKVPLTIYQKAALISFTYNLGPTKLASSGLAKQFNSGNYSAGCNSLLDWVYAKRKKLPGLIARRNLEYQWCMGELNAD
jgi:lysozyme